MHKKIDGERKVGRYLGKNESRKSRLGECVVIMMSRIHRRTLSDYFYEYCSTS